MYFLYCVCLTRRSTATTTVLCILSLTTMPSRTFVRPRMLSNLSGGLRTGPLALNGLDARDVAPRVDQCSGALELVGSPAQAQMKELFLQLTLAQHQLLIAQIAHFA